MKVCVVGLGYIGLPTALMMAANDVSVIGVDYSKPIIDQLRSGKLTFAEDGLGDLFSLAVSKGIVFTDEYPSADLYVIAVPTPYDKHSKKIDPSYVVSAVRSVCAICPPGAIIAVESTIAPGTTDAYIRPVVAECGLKIGKDVHLAHVPERIIPGKMLYELKNNGRTIGADSLAIAEAIRSVYEVFCGANIILTDIRSAEMSKIVENTFRDINIAYANELSKICHAANLDVYEIIQIANQHPRVNILSPGPGVGGHCISVDPWFLVGDFPDLANLTREARHVNESMPHYVLARTREIMIEEGITEVSRIGFYGLTYKENVDDTRESPLLQLLEIMDVHLAGSNVCIYDPYVTSDIVPGQLHSLESFLEAIDLLVVMVAHDELIQNEEKLVGKVVFDTRRCLHKCNARFL